MQQIWHMLAIAALAVSSIEANNLSPVDTNPLQPRGSYRYLYHGIFKVYDATLFAPPGVNPKAILAADCQFELQLHYLRNIKKNTILKSANRMLEKNLAPDELRQIQEQVDKLHQAYTDVRSADRAALHYHPNHGTTLFLNDKPCITLKGKDFARLYFQIWLGQRPVSPAMRENLLVR